MSCEQSLRGGSPGTSLGGEFGEVNLEWNCEKCGVRAG